MMLLSIQSIQEYWNSKGPLKRPECGNGFSKNTNLWEMFLWFSKSSFCPCLEPLFALHLVYARKIEEVTQVGYESWDEHWQIILIKLFLSIESTSNQPCVCQNSK